MLLPTFDELQSFPLKNHWNQAHFKNDQPIGLDWDGKRISTVSLAQVSPKEFYWNRHQRGKNVEGSHRRIIKTSNVAFLRTQVH